MTDIFHTGSFVLSFTIIVMILLLTIGVTH
jgi:hypothetical protein